MAEQAKTFIERMVTGFFGGWTPTDKLAFVYFMAGIILSYSGKFDPKDLMTFAWGFLAGRSEMGLQGMGMMPYPGMTPYNGMIPIQPYGNQQIPPGGQNLEP
jgi:hypothetical protein